MRVLVACERSGVVRSAFLAVGCEAWSCDLAPAEDDGPHLTGDVREFLDAGWDLLIAHPPCTHLSVSGARWFPEKRDAQAEALAFVLVLMGAAVPRIAVENPVSIISTEIRPPDQIIQPWQFGHSESKTTCLWLKGLPELQPTHLLGRPDTGKLYWNNQTPSRQNKLGPSPTRGQQRARTYQGIAEAMAAQWGSLVTNDRTTTRMGSRSTTDAPRMCYPDSQMRLWT